MQSVAFDITPNTCKYAVTSAVVITKQVSMRNTKHWGIIFSENKTSLLLCCTDL